MVGKTIGDYMAQIEDGLAGIRQLTKHEPSQSMDDEAGEGEPVPKTIGRGRKQRPSMTFAKADDSDISEEQDAGSKS